MLIDVVIHLDDTCDGDGYGLNHSCTIVHWSVLADSGQALAGVSNGSPVVHLSGERRARIAVQHLGVHGPADHGGHCEQKGQQATGWQRQRPLLHLTTVSHFARFASFPERFRLPLGPVRALSAHLRLFLGGSSVFRRRDGAFDFARDQSETGICERRSRRAAPVPGRLRAEVDRASVVAAHRPYAAHETGRPGDDSFAPSQIGPQLHTFRLHY